MLIEKFFKNDKLIYTSDLKVSQPEEVSKLLDAICYEDHYRIEGGARMAGIDPWEVYASYWIISLDKLLCELSKAMPGEITASRYKVGNTIAERRLTVINSNPIMLPLQRKSAVSRIKQPNKVIP